MKDTLIALAGSALPTLMVPVGIWLNRSDIRRLMGVSVPWKAHCGER